MNDGLILGEDGKQRCWWCGNDPLYIDYHDNEWGYSQTNDVRLFEKLCLEGFQAGLSWITVLRKRENFRLAFNGFDFYKISTYTDVDVERLLNNEGIIRHEGKIRSVINNAAKVIEILEEYQSFYEFLKEYKPIKRHDDIVSSFEELKQQSMTDESKKLSKDLKKRGFKFVGPTTIYALMQAMGMVNDHLDGCFVRKKINAC